MDKSDFVMNEKNHLSCKNRDCFALTEEERQARLFIAEYRGEEIDSPLHEALAILEALIDRAVRIRRQP